MSDFIYQPAYGASVAKEPRVLTAQYGDGYEQRVGDGINTVRQIWRLNFSATQADITAIDAFLTAKGGVDSFTWTPSGESEIRVKCTDWNRARTAPRAGTISATFTQVFES
jgi:phage-related protein